MTALPPGLTLTLSNDPDPAARAYLMAGLTSFHEALLGPGTSGPFAALLHDSVGTLQGGVWGRNYYNWFFIEMLFIEEAHRAQGLGATLLATAEAEAIKRRCTGLWLDTMNPNALHFYLRHGFESFGELPNYPNNTRRVFLRKTFA
ncbi:MAG TPA: GNAT family N-acetyltransferase [Acidocella sp.]|nr:MAG: hypothetical protein B7Z71_01990 [Acidocella sp. 21-58-7]HQT62961.1 GNAT family N-acetyltransferase [Acidocella sp.]HQU04637.1 GNAT family N-acetyltransferase [Acidocella sp.]